MDSVQPQDLCGTDLLAHSSPETSSWGQAGGGLVVWQGSGTMKVLVCCGGRPLSEKAGPAKQWAGPLRLGSGVRLLLVQVLRLRMLWTRAFPKK